MNQRLSKHFVKTVVAVGATAIALQSSPVFAQCDPSTNTVAIAAKAARDGAVSVIENAGKNSNAVYNEAMNCLQQVKKLLSLISMPGFPNLTGLALDQLLSYLTGQACKVVVGKVAGAISSFPPIPNLPTIATFPGGPTLTPTTVTVGGATASTYSDSANGLLSQITGSANQAANDLKDAGTQATATIQNILNPPPPPPPVIDGTTPAPDGTTPAPGGTTPAPGGTTPAPGGTTPAPGGGGGGGGGGIWSKAACAFGGTCQATNQQRR